MKGKFIVEVEIGFEVNDKTAYLEIPLIGKIEDTIKLEPFQQISLWKELLNEKFGKVKEVKTDAGGKEKDSKI